MSKPTALNAALLEHRRACGSPPVRTDYPEGSEWHCWACGQLIAWLGAKVRDGMKDAVGNP